MMFCLNESPASNGKAINTHLYFVMFACIYFSHDAGATSTFTVCFGTQQAGRKSSEKQLESVAYTH